MLAILLSCFLSVFVYCTFFLVDLHRDSEDDYKKVKKGCKKKHKSKK